MHVLRSLDFVQEQNLSRTVQKVVANRVQEKVGVGLFWLRARAKLLAGDALPEDTDDGTSTPCALLYRCMAGSTPNQC